MPHPSHSRTLSCAGLLSLLICGGLFGLIQPVTKAQQPEVTEEASGEANKPPVYRVQFLKEDDTLNIYAGPGVQYKVVGTLGYIDEMQATGDEKHVGEDVWLPIQAPYDSSITGWINRLYAVKQIDPAVFVPMRMRAPWSMK